MSVIVHRFTPNLKGTRSRKLEEKRKAAADTNEFFRLLKIII
jgi:hypothetical protein